MKVNAQGSDSLDVTRTLDDETRARFLLQGIVYQKKKKKSDFYIDEKSLSKEYVITDLR